MQSMTGFASQEFVIPAVGRINIELRSINHKFLELVFHLPEPLLSLEEKIRKSAEKKIVRGRLSCMVVFNNLKTQRVRVDSKLAGNYVAALKKIKAQFGLQDEININSLMMLPGVVSLDEDGVVKEKLWEKISPLFDQVLSRLIAVREKEGAALLKILKRREGELKKNLAVVKKRFYSASRAKIKKMATDEERSSFLKATDITEEIDRLAFHVRNFAAKLNKKGPLGKELDFIAQEMQREANTLSAKSFDVVVSSRVIQIKSQIDKIREQALNVE